jgi:hypothetical protein
MEIKMKKINLVSGLFTAEVKIALKNVKIGKGGGGT